MMTSDGARVKVIVVEPIEAKTRAVTVHSARRYRDHERNGRRGGPMIS
jgi:hypothetical protein